MLRNRVKELRLARGWSQEALAQRADTTNQNISNVEERGDLLDLLWAKRLGTAFGVPAEDVIDAGIDQELMRDCLVCLLETMAVRNKELPAPTMASVAVLLYQELRQVTDPEERRRVLPVITRALYAQAAGKDADEAAD